MDLAPDKKTRNHGAAVPGVAMDAQNIFNHPTFAVLDQR